MNKLKEFEGIFLGIQREVKNIIGSLVIPSDLVS
jgi:hypothetical protein